MPDNSNFLPRFVACRCRLFGGHEAEIIATALANVRDERRQAGSGIEAGMSARGIEKYGIM